MVTISDVVGEELCGFGCVLTLGHTGECIVVSPRKERSPSQQVDILPSVETGGWEEQAEEEEEATPTSIGGMMPYVSPKMRAKRKIREASNFESPVLNFAQEHPPCCEDPLDHVPVASAFVAPIESSSVAVPNHDIDAMPMEKLVENKDAKWISPLAKSILDQLNKPVPIVDFSAPIAKKPRNPPAKTPERRAAPPAPGGLMNNQLPLMTKGPAPRKQPVQFSASSWSTPVVF